MIWNRILLIHDGYEHSKRAVEYVMTMFGQTDGVRVTLFGLHEKIPRHDFKNTSPIVGKLERQISTMEVDIERAKASITDSQKLLVSCGIGAECVQVKFVERKHSAVKDIIEEADAEDYGTIVLGRGETGSLVMVGGGIAKDLVSAVKKQVVIVV